MSQVTRISAILLAVMVLTGCASLNSIHRTHDFKTGSAIIDAKQRAIIAREDLKNGVLVCAEPSPDAMSAYAAELAGKVGVPNKVAAEFVGSFHEGSSFVGLRTQSIQLLRDESYRLCEAHMNGFIDDEQYFLLLRRQQRITVALLAIEQLTETVKVPNVLIETNGTAVIGKDVSGIIALNGDNNKPADPKANENEVGEGNNVQADGKDNGRSQAAGAATASVATINTPSQRTDAHIQAIAEYVDRIVKYTQADDLGQLCLAHMKGHNDGVLLERCSSYIQAIIDHRSTSTRLIEVLQNKIYNVEISNASDLKKLVEAIVLLQKYSDDVGIQVLLAQPKPVMSIQK